MDKALQDTPFFGENRLPWERLFLHVSLLLSGDQSHVDFLVS